jgi:dihydrolipoamide dehydrogenase
LKFTSVPKHLVVLGGGVIGLEMGSIWSRVGSQVTVVEASPGLLPSMDGGLVRAAQKIFEKQGLSFLLGTKGVRLEKTESNFILHCEGAGGKAISLSGDKLLVAVGRRPCVIGLNLEELGIDLNETGRILVHQNFETSCSGVYALGDVIPGPMLAHKAEEEGIALAQKLAGRFGHADPDTVGSVVYTWPEIASVGLSEEQCKTKSIPYRSGQFSFRANGRAKAMGETEGFVKILSHKETDRILGVHILGPSGSELLGEATLAMTFGASAEDLASTVHAHPTLAEAIKEAALDVEKRAIHH